MLPSSSSHLARYGQINHFKKFWLLQTQLEKQEQSTTSTTALSLGVSSIGSANVVKESKPLISSNSLIANGDHSMNTTNLAGHGSCRGDMVSSSPSSTSTSRAGAFPYCSTDPTSLKLYNNSRLGYSHMTNIGSLRDSPAALSLAVNCDSVAHPINFFNPTWASPTYSPSSELQSRNSPRVVVPAITHINPQVKGSAGAEEYCDSSECSFDRGLEKRGLVVWDNASTSPSTSTLSLSSKVRQHELAGPQGHDPSSMITPSVLQGAAVLPSSSRSGHGSTGPLRTCTLCGTMKTPLWRSGPQGPKSLCNACGIRVKKAKRLQAAMEAAGEGAEGIISSASSPAMAYKRLLAAAATTTSKATGRSVTSHKRKLSMEAAENLSDPIVQLKKTKKKAAGSRRSSCGSWPSPKVTGLDSGTCYRIFGEASSANLVAALVIDNTSSKKSSNLFAKDVEEAAVLLMALSCGLVLS